MSEQLAYFGLNMAIEFGLRDGFNSIGCSMKSCIEKDGDQAKHRPLCKKLRILDVFSRPATQCSKKLSIHHVF